MCAWGRRGARRPSFGVGGVSPRLIAASPTQAVCVSPCRASSGGFQRRPLIGVPLYGRRPPSDAAPGRLVGPLASENYRNKKPRAVWADAGLTGASLDGEIDAGQEKNWRREPLFRVASLKLGPNPYIVASVMSGAKQCDDRPYSEAVYNRGAAAVGKSLLEPKRRCSPLATGSAPPSDPGVAVWRSDNSAILNFMRVGLSRPRAHCSSNS
jgi:hypothetical protein